MQRGALWPALAVGVTVFALVTIAIILVSLAYADQSSKVESLERENTRILGDHTVIGKRFATQSEEFAEQNRKLEEALRSSFRQGYLAGRRVQTLPAALRPLERQAANGLLVPRRMPRGLDPRRMRISTKADGYTIRWRSLAVFASTDDPLSVWTRQALGGLQRTVKVGRRRVVRFVGPTGIVYTWREGKATYALLAFPRLELTGRALIRSMQ